MRRPAETTTLGAGGLAGVVAGAAGAPPALAVALWAVGALPHLVTFLVDHGGVAGTARTLWRGRKP
jgi:hypothetical protein